MDVQELYVKYGPMVLRRCRTLLSHEEQAVDALQDVFVQVIRFQDRLENRGLSSLLYTMATNTCLNLIRGLKSKQRFHFNAETSEDLLMDIACSEDHVEKLLAQDVVDNFFLSEMATSRTLATFYFVDGMTLEETAAAVGLSVSGVRKRLSKLKARGRALREKML